MADDCWGPNTRVKSREPAEWATHEGYKAFHARYKHVGLGLAGSAWTCQLCGAMTKNTDIHDEWHANGANR